jgi:hypothetical protein
MEVKVAVGKADQGTLHIADVIQPHLAELSRFLSGEYGGPMAHLWIDLELHPADADRREPFAFRFQKRVAVARELKALGVQEHFNVGHFGVRPDYFALAAVPLPEVPRYLLRLIYDGSH